MNNNTNSNNQEGLNGLYFIQNVGSKIYDRGYIHRVTYDSQWIVSDVSNSGVISKHQKTVGVEYSSARKFFTNKEAFKLFLAELL